MTIYVWSHMVTQVKAIPGQTESKLPQGLPVTSGNVLAWIHAELGEMYRELDQSRLTTTAIDRMCERDPKLRNQLIDEMNAILDERKAALLKRPKRR